MRTFLIGLLVLAALVVAYALWVRPWLRTKSWARGVFALIEPIELALWMKSETILWARFQMLVGLLIPLLQFIGAIDLTPYLAVIPADLVPWLIAGIALAGFITEQLRKDTTKPLEVVAIPQAAPTEVKEAVIEAAVANAEAVNAVERAKAQEKI